MKISCDVIMDLIPLVKDGVASEDSSSIVKEHIQNCESCRAEFEGIEAAGNEKPLLKDKKIIAALKRSFFITQLTLLIAGTLVGVTLSNSMEMFNNLYIMPVVGALGLAAFKKKWYIVPLCVFVLSSLWQGVSGFMEGTGFWESLSQMIYISAIYAFLVFLGVTIAALLKFAFGTGEQLERKIQRKE